MNNASAPIEIRNTDKTILWYREAQAWAIRKHYLERVDLKRFQSAVLLAS